MSRLGSQSATSLSLTPTTNESYGWEDRPPITTQKRQVMVLLSRLPLLARCSGSGSSLNYSLNCRVVIRTYVNESVMQECEKQASYGNSNL